MTSKTIKKEYIEVSGARENNLKDIDVKIPRGEYTVVTGLSGSGKSSLALDTVYSEGLRRYIECLSTYARQFLERVDRPARAASPSMSPSMSSVLSTAPLSRRPSSITIASLRPPTPSPTASTLSTGALT